MISKKVLFTATVVKTHINAFHLPFLKMFKDAGWEVHVAAKNDFIDEPCLIPNCDKYYDIDFDRFPFSRRNFHAYKKLQKIILENQYDIVHCHTPVAGVLTRLAARLCNNTRVIYTAHGFHFFKGAPLINWLIYYPVERFCARYTDKLITINKEDYERAKQFKLRNNGKVYYIPGVGMDINKIKNVNIDINEKKKELGIPDDIPVILSVGELNENKNHEVVIQALDKIKEQKYIYIIAGRGKLEDYLNSLIKEKCLTEKVRLLGYRKDIAELLNITDIFVFPSLREGLSVALMEAMSAGLPIIASNIRGNRDLLCNNDLFDPRDIHKLMKLIKSKLNIIGNGEKIKVNYSNMDNYSLDNVLKQMVEIYGEEN